MSGSYLLDTNVFLEVLLGQSKSGICRDFLLDNATGLHLSDFSLHSVGVILFRQGKEEIYDAFVSDLHGKIYILSLSQDLYGELSKTKSVFGLDFDDAYQFLIAQAIGLELVTMDRHFEAVKEAIRIKFL